jgi:cytochrome c oxidase subunit 4
MSDTTHTTHAHESHDLLYKKIFGLLMVLTTITVLIALVHLGFLNIPIALAIAATKASVVALYFMHLKTDGRRDPYLYIAALFPILLLLILSCALMPDIVLHQGDAVRFLKP